MLSVFICTYNPTEAFLERAIKSILDQDLEAEEWEFIIIDNNSQYPVKEFSFIKELNVRVFVESKQGLTAARGKAVEIARGDVLVFVDDDNVLSKNYLSVVKCVFMDSEIGVISGNIYPEYQLIPDKWFFKHEEMLAVRRFEGTDLILNNSLIFNNYFPIGAGMCIRKELIEEYYNAHLTSENYIEGRKAGDLSSCEDIDLDFFALFKNYKIGICTLLKVIHIIPNRRIKFEYIINLARSSLQSTYYVNRKWSKVFNANVFEYYNLNILKLILRTIVHKSLSFRKSHGVQYVFFSNILKFKLLKR